MYVGPCQTPFARSFCETSEWLKVFTLRKNFHCRCWAGSNWMRGLGNRSICLTTYIPHENVRKLLPFYIFMVIEMKQLTKMG